MNIKTVFFFFIGFFICVSANAQVEYYGGDSGKKLDWVIYYLNKHYVDSTDNEYLTDVAIKRIAEELDEYSVYQTAKEIEDLNNADNGYSPESYGFNFFPVGDTSYVTYIFRDGPADEAGLKIGDRIISINKTPVTAANYARIDEFVSDTTLSELDLVINSSTRKKQKISIPKKLVPLKSVDAHFMHDKFTGYLKIGRFTVNTVKEFEEAINLMKENGLSNLILDLRGNYGGVVTAAMDLADKFLTTGKLMSYSEGFNLERKEYISENRATMGGINLVILIDENSMSAAEMFTAALQDWDRALVLGYESYGKGLIQQSYSFEDGSAIRMTIGKYFTPAGRYLQRAKEDGNMMENFLTQPSEYSVNIAPTSMRKTTKTGREITASSGGIIPDIYMYTNSPNSESLNRLNEHGLLYGFTCSFMFGERERYLKEYPSSVSYINSTQVDMDIKQVLGNFIVQEVNRQGLDKSLIPYTIPDDIIKEIKAWMAGQLWNDNAYFQMKSYGDPVFQRALATFKDGSFRSLNLFAY